MDEFMALNERMLPVIEWAEGQKKLLVERGWSEESAERYAAEMLVGATRSVWATVETTVKP